MEIPHTDQPGNPDFPGMEVPHTDQPLNPEIPGIPEMEVPHTDQPGNPGFPEMELPHSVAPSVVYAQELRQKRETAEDITVYNCYTVTEGGKPFK